MEDHAFNGYTAPNQDYLNVQERPGVYESQFHSNKSSNAGMSALSNPRYTQEELARFMVHDPKMVANSQQLDKNYEDDNTRNKKNALANSSGSSV